MNRPSVLFTSDLCNHICVILARIILNPKLKQLYFLAVICFVDNHILCSLKYPSFRHNSLQMNTWHSCKRIVPFSLERGGGGVTLSVHPSLIPYEWAGASEHALFEAFYHSPSTSSTFPAHGWTAVSTWPFVLDS